MLRNHIRFALRLFVKDGAYSILNILGLTLGISVGIILFLYLQHDLNYDLHHQRHKEIYRFTNHLKAEGADFNTSRVARELATILKQDLPEIKDYVRFLPVNNVTFTYQENDNIRQHIENDVVYADSNVLRVFTHPFVLGNPEGALTGPNKIVISESVSKKFFNDANPIGKQLTIDGENFMVTGVMENPPKNSHLYYEIILSGFEERPWVVRNREEGNAERVSEAFWNPSSYLYLVMPENYDREGFNAKFQDLIFEKTFGLFAKRISGSVTTKLTPLADVHFYSDQYNDEPQGNISYLIAFTSIGILIILLACINYMNMATARSVIRTTEMAIRKVLGYSKWKLFTSVLIESIVMASIAMFLAVFIVFIVLNFTPFLSLIDKDLSFDLLGNPMLLVGIILITILVGIISGIYPATYIPSMPVVSALKGKSGHTTSNAWLRKVLIVFQFVISLFVIISTFLMDKQIGYMRTTELGFSDDNVVMIDVPDTTVRNRIESIKAEMLSHGNILSATNSYGVPGVDVGGQVFMVEKEGELAQQSMNVLWVGKDYLETMGIELIDGRNWLDDSEAERSKIIVNQTAVEEFGWEDNPFDKRIRYFHGEEDMHVVGIVKDFNFESLHNPIQPLFIITGARGGTFQLRINSEDIPGTLSFIEETWTSFSPNHPYEYRFLDQEFEAQYRQDEIQKSLISMLSYISIFISLLGLIGLSAFTAGQKAKEIGVRKTLGATVPSILVLFSKSYLKLIVIAFAIAIPLANYLITEWRADFAYQLPIKWWFFAIPGVMVIAVGLIAVVLQSLKAARANPAEALRTE